MSGHRESLDRLWKWILWLTKGGQRYYVQSAYQMLSDEKMIQEKRSLLHINDSFKKILLTMDHQNVRHDENGIVTMGLMHFLSDQNSLEA